MSHPILEFPIDYDIVKCLVKNYHAEVNIGYDEIFKQEYFKFIFGLPLKDMNSTAVVINAHKGDKLYLLDDGTWKHVPQELQPDKVFEILERHKETLKQNR